ncbi:hypothetical protein [Dyadobacter psychrotolerans]|uniref:Uncharacterized protein n=1 Tax=Dyadobacter psychrotolerans TaxID=2541721 RepID=A0A4R5DG44_9BACT|nr:hypothetical protein [Dyadobacter psychrotolerans]TDE12769.1 hypothetical protein E0F88_20695 [Dyadobacter psychrotolerans]
MSLSRAEYLINRLISNNLSGEELSELLEAVGNEEQQHSYSDVLENYFYRLVQESENDAGSDSKQ